ncbi:hypothetical protein VULLAG_LOCUS13866 [Vulpes lagopus]
MHPALRESQQQGCQREILSPGLRSPCQLRGAGAEASLPVCWVASTFVSPPCLLEFPTSSSSSRMATRHPRLKSVSASELMTFFLQAWLMLLQLISRWSQLRRLSITTSVCANGKIL